MLENLTRLMAAISLEIMVILTAAMPVVELRGAIPAGIALGLAPWHAFILGVIGSMLPVPFILWFIKPIFEWLGKRSFLKPIIERIKRRTLEKSDKIERYGFWGLLIFVAIPLPGTGVWSGALAAVLLNLRFRKAFFAIFFGNMVAGLIMMSFSHFFFG